MTVHTALSLLQLQMSSTSIKEIFADADWFHFTGITPAVSDAAIELTEAALKAAKAHGVTVSVDLNCRNCGLLKRLRRL